MITAHLAGALGLVEEAFLHKRVIGGVAGFLTGGPTGAALGFARGGGGAQNAQLGTRALAPVPLAQVPVSEGGLCVVGCTSASQRTPTPGFRGFAERILPGGASGFESAEVVMGRYGSAMVPITEDRRTLTCLPGMALGKDDLCYNLGKNGISNSQRKWPKGRAPLLTGGERNAITKAARAATKIKNTEKALRKMGMLPALPSARKAKAKPAQKMIAGPGITVIDTE